MRRMRPSFDLPFGLKSTLLGDLFLARLAGLCAAVRSIEEVLSMTFWRTCKAVIEPIIFDGLLHGSYQAIVGVALVVTLTALRVLVSTAGIICPELTFGVFRLHKFLLWLGLWNRARSWHSLLFERAAYGNPIVRQRALQIMMALIEGREQAGAGVSHRGFRNIFGFLASGRQFLNWAMTATAAMGRRRPLFRRLSMYLPSPRDKFKVLFGSLFMSATPFLKPFKRTSLGRFMKRLLRSGSKGYTPKMKLRTCGRRIEPS